MRGRGNYLMQGSSGFPVIPMIDVIFNLLLFFMLISRNLPPALSVALPQADAATPTDNPPAIAMSINAEGQLMLDGDITEWDQLGPMLKDIAAKPDGGSTQVRIAADKEVDYDYVVRALDAAAQAGLTNVALETSPSESGMAPAESSSNAGAAVASPGTEGASDAPAGGSTPASGGA